ncbi:DUF6207 family protein [Streptomyces nigrescens]|uniref:DUF6207 family protein n=1 Tax=Streptomyces nigrescens TaxID=1920 RepID=UPI0037027E3D
MTSTGCGELSFGEGRLADHEDLRRALREPGLIDIDVIAADEETATEAATALGGLWLSSGPSTTWRTPGDVA